MIKRITITCFCVLINATVLSQIINEAPYILTIDELKAWTTSGPTASDELISTTALAERFINTSTQLNPSLSNDMQIAYLPDGMNNFANYGTEQDQFNLYNFMNWAYIDKLVWFGGTASQTVQLPSAPWTNAAHKNGVKVLGNIFFAPNAFGGSTATMLNFLEQDTSGNFIVIPILVEIMEYYKFDGWFINEETSTNAATANLMYEFMRDLTAAVDALGKEVMWYDAMLLSGAVGWQNRLNTNNSVFVQNDQDGDSSNGFETKVSSSIFINFFWNTAGFPSSSRTRAQTIARSEFDVFTGVDVWPGRNQAPFQTGGNNWMNLLFESEEVAFTSLGLFAPNCVFNNSLYSNFSTVDSDFASFYSEERHMFSGKDRNPAIEDPAGFKGYAHWVPAASVITQMPFETNFNIGHGIQKFEEGVQTSSDFWHNMNDQDILPTWQFAFSQNDALTADWQLDEVYNGGSSLHISGDIPAETSIDLLLYKTKILVTPDTKIDLVSKFEGMDQNNMRILVSFTDDPGYQVPLFLSNNSATTWNGETAGMAAFAGRELATVGLRFRSSEPQNNINVWIGNLKIHEGDGLGTDEFAALENGLSVLYPRANPDQVILQFQRPTTTVIKYQLVDLRGRIIDQNSITANTRSYTINVGNLAKGTYLVQLSDSNSGGISRKIIKQ